MPPNHPNLTTQEKARILREAQTGHWTRLKELKTNYPAFHWIDLRSEKTGDTILHCASRLGHIGLVDYLLQTEPNEASAVDCRNNDGKTALHEAAQFTRTDCLRSLLRHGSDVNALKRGDWTALMLACTKPALNSYATVAWLLLRGALVTCRNKDGWTALHVVCREGSVTNLRLLLDHDLDVGSRTNNGRSALHIAALHRHIDVIEFLLDMSADKSQRVRLDSTCRDCCGNTALHKAVLGGSVDVCRMLIARVEDFSRDCNQRSMRNFADLNLLHLAAAGVDISEGVAIDMIRFLINEHRFDVNEANDKGYTALHCAARSNRSEVYRVLVEEFGAQIDLKDKFGRCALDYMNLKNVMKIE